MSTQKSPARELAEKMWYDVTGYRPGMKESSSLTSTAEEFRRAEPARVTVSIPDLDRPVESVEELGESRENPLAQLLYLAAGPLVAGVVLGGFMLGAYLFAGKEEPVVGPPLRVAATTRGVAPLSAQTEATPSNSTQAQRQNNPWPGLPHQPVSVTGATRGIWQPSAGEENGQPVGLPPSHEGWGFTGVAQDSATSAEAPLSVAWINPGSVGGVPREGQTERAVAEAVHTVSASSVPQALNTSEPKGQLSGSDLNQARETRSVPEGFSGPRPEGLPPSVTPASFNGPAQPEVTSLGVDPTRVYPATSPESRPAGGWEIKPTSAESTSSFDPRQSPSPNAQKSAGVEILSSGEKSPVSSGGEKIAGLAWLRGEREFVISRRSSSVGGSVEPQEALPVSLKVEQGGTMSVGDLGIGAPPPQAGIPTMPQFASGIPPSNLPTTAAGATGEVYSASINHAQYSLPSTGMAYPGIVYAAPTGPANSQIVVNPTVVPSGGWQNVDPSSFRWGIEAGGTAARPPGTLGPYANAWNGGTSIPPAQFTGAPGSQTPSPPSQFPPAFGMPVSQPPGNPVYPPTAASYPGGRGAGETTNSVPVTAWGPSPGYPGPMNR